MIHEQQPSEEKKIEEELSSDEKFEKMWERIRPPEWSAYGDEIMPKGLVELEEKAQLKKDIEGTVASIVFIVVFIAVIMIWGRW